MKEMEEDDHMAEYQAYIESKAEYEAATGESYEDRIVHSPEHYQSLNDHGIEAIEAIQASMSDEAFEGYLKGAVLKYLWRYQRKGNAIQDLKKARWYLNRLIDENL